MTPHNLKPNRFDFSNWKHSMDIDFSKDSKDFYGLIKTTILSTSPSSLCQNYVNEILQSPLDNIQKINALAYIYFFDEFFCNFSFPNQNTGTALLNYLKEAIFHNNASKFLYIYICNHATNLEITEDEKSLAKAIRLTFSEEDKPFLHMLDYFDAASQHNWNKVLEIAQKGAEYFPFLEFTLGHMYFEGIPEVAERNLPKAIEYFKSSAKRGFISSCQVLANLYAYSTEIENNFELADMYFAYTLEQCSRSSFYNYTIYQLKIYQDYREALQSLYYATYLMDDTFSEKVRAILSQIQQGTADIISNKEQLEMDKIAINWVSSHSDKTTW